MCILSQLVLNININININIISNTCKCRLLVLLNAINKNLANSAKLNETIANVNKITLRRFKSVIKSYMIKLMCIHNTVISLTVLFVKFSNYFYL